MPKKPSSRCIPHTGVVSIVVGLTSGQFVEAGMLDRNRVVGSAAPLDGATALNRAGMPLFLATLERDDGLFPGLQVFQFDHTWPSESAHCAERGPSGLDRNEERRLWIAQTARYGSLSSPPILFRLPLRCRARRVQIPGSSHPPYLDLGRLPRTSRNSFGPLRSLRFRRCRSSSVADGSLRRSISLPAISSALAAFLVRPPAEGTLCACSVAMIDLHSP